MKISKIISYKQGSASAAALSASLEVKRVKHVGKPILLLGTVLNWGCSQFPDRIQIHPGAGILNSPEAIRKASNKLEAFKLLQGRVPLPPWSESRDEASEWLPAPVVCRTLLNGHSGNGIVLANTKEEIVDSPLYTMYKKKIQEYRIHAGINGAFFVQRKARKKEIPDEEVNWQIRNHQNGFIYANKDVKVPEPFKEIAVEAVKALGLDFGAVDLIVDADNKAYVLEVNTAPGLEGTTLERYCVFFRDL